MRFNKHVIVTGGAGFIGSHIAQRLLFEGYKVTILDNLSTGKEENIPKDADFVKIDLTQNTVSKFLNKIACDAVFHLAGQSSGEMSFRDPFYDLQSHIMSTFWLLEWCKNKGVKRFIFSSSMSIYGNPEYLPVDENHPHHPKTFYAAAKISAEAYIKLYQTLGINTTIFRLFSVYGPGQNLNNKLQGMVSIFLSYMLEKASLIVKGSKERFRDFVYIDDVVDAWLIAFNNPITYGNIYNLASGKKTTVETLLETLKSSFGYVDYPIEFKEGTLGDQFGVLADTKRIMKELNWKPNVYLKKGIRKTVEFEKRRKKK